MSTTASFTDVNGNTVTVTGSTVTELTVGINSATTYVHTVVSNEAGGGFVLGDMETVKAALVTAGGTVDTDAVSPQFDQTVTFN